MTDLLRAEGVEKQFAARGGGMFAPHQRLMAVAGVDLELNPGETLGIAGESGCGKSTVARLLTGLIPLSGGRVTYQGRDLAALSRAEMALFRREVQMIFQDPFSSLNPRMRVSEILAEPMVIHGIGTEAQRRDRVDFLMNRVGLLPEQLSRFPHEFSGGQRQRIGIARALAVSPKLIIADEPVSALDLSIQAQIINLLQEVKRELGLGFLFITHDLSVLRHVSDRIAIMYLGRIVESGSAEEVLEHPRHPYTEALLAAIPSVDPKKRRKHAAPKGEIPSPLAPPSGCPFHPRCPYAEERCRVERPDLVEKDRPGHRAACHFSEKLPR
ncbi:ABC transporter ATP-binding protein [Geomesophilobacter sediminis]|uniref:ATP-binding cassette domain-containing protein n=1 Tax=Geomesophilobacter sediminis TaxID=2798584 RepID=A0A8J7JGD2_9BACT|nr:oligopeptide/dipeptide ABC transporter ATP-binding protein [Geomesophilobacter sediminis]MBJ6723555.1 ATP-binding cassette domain-containing protein [Geomesophilobacter sediminis]